MIIHVLRDASLATSPVTEHTPLTARAGAPCGPDTPWPPRARHPRPSQSGSVWRYSLLAAAAT